MIGMEHPKLPAKVGDPPVQLWVKKEDSAVRYSIFLKLHMKLIVYN